MVALKKPLRFPNRPKPKCCPACDKYVPDATNGWVPRSFAWCRMCGKSFKGHQQCIDGIRAVRDKHEKTCLRVVIPQTRLRCE